MGAPNCPTPNKKGYKDRSAAKRHEWSLLRRKATQRDWKTLHAYQCRCGLWHVGHRGGRA